MGAARTRCLMAWSSAAVISSSAGNSARTAATRRARDLAWSYASFLAAVRAKTGKSVLGWPPDAQEKDARPFGQRTATWLSPGRHGA
jgi:type II secretory pathway pseudopilin PulG